MKETVGRTGSPHESSQPKFFLHLWYMGLETVEIVMALEDYFRIKIPDSDASRCITVADLQAVIVKLLVEHGARDDDETWNKVWAGIITVLWGEGYDVARIRPDSKWIGDITLHG